MTGPSAIACPICHKAVPDHDPITAAMHAFDMRRTGLVSDEQFRNALIAAGREA